MVEKIVMDYLNEILEVPAYMEMPEDAPEKFVLIEKTSGSEDNFIKTATITLQSYAGSLFDAASLNEWVKDAMRNITVLATVSKSKLNSDYNYTDITKKQYRYQAVYDLVYFD